MIISEWKDNASKPTKNRNIKLKKPFSCFVRLFKSIEMNANETTYIIYLKTTPKPLPNFLPVKKTEPFSKYLAYIPSAKWFVTNSNIALELNPINATMSNKGIVSLVFNVKKRVENNNKKYKTKL